MPLFSFVPRLQHVESFLLLAAVGVDSLHVVVVLNAGQYASGRPEVFQNPGRSAAETLYLVQHGTVLAVQVLLELLGPSLVLVAVQAILGTSAELADDNGLVFQPEIVFHLAAQPIVRRSYEEPVYTYETNVIGTVNVLECIRRHDCVKAAVMITTDKVYDNLEDGHAYREDERLDGYDPYSNSKSCASLAIHSYKRSFLDEKGVSVSDLRAGNVIGGGDYAADRILPDCVRSAQKAENVKVRNPHSVRPYQHVLEPLSAYLLVAQKTYEDPSLAGTYNVGPDDSDAAETGRIADIFAEAWGEGIGWEAGNPDGPHEANYLRLSHEKITETFGWKPVWDIEEAVRKTVEWTKASDKKAETDREIEEFLKKAEY